MLKDKISDLIKDSLMKAKDSGELGELKNIPDSITLDQTKNPAHGDKATNIAMRLSKEAKMAPRAIAESIVKNLKPNSFTNVDIAGPGFINMTLGWDILEDLISEVHEKDSNFGKSESAGRPDKSYSKVMIEYVSANPTGDLHLGHGRQAVYGSALAELLKWAGYEVAQEFYINDAGVQMQKLAQSVKQFVLINEGKAEQNSYDAENNYPFDSMQEFITQEKYSKLIKDKDLEKLEDDFWCQLGRNIFLKAHQDILSSAKVNFDKWYSEKENLYDAGNKVEEVCQKFLADGNAYESEAALWFKAKEFGDERDRVLKKADGNFTYLAADYAYHQNKLSRGFDKLINIWGADHHGQVPGIKGGLQALGAEADKLEVILMQLVSLMKDGQEVKMSKREGNVVTVRELIQKVGLDAFRYFLVESQANNRMAFDLDLAIKQDKDNPVYYIQYAHARCCSIVRTLTSEQLDQENKEVQEPIVSSEELLKWELEFKSSNNLFQNCFANLSENESRSTKDLILALADFPEEIKEAAFNKSPNKIAHYVKNLATLFHQFYTHNRVIGDDLELVKARSKVVMATQKVIKNALTILSLSAPERM